MSQSEESFSGTSLSSVVSGGSPALSGLSHPNLPLTGRCFFFFFYIIRLLSHTWPYPKFVAVLQVWGIKMYWLPPFNPPSVGKTENQGWTVVEGGLEIVLLSHPPDFLCYSRQPFLNKSSFSQSMCSSLETCIFVCLEGSGLLTIQRQPRCHWNYLFYLTLYMFVFYLSY